MLKLRDYQVEIKGQVYNAWNSGYKNVLMVLPTGLGKTKTFTSIVIDSLGVGLSTAIMVHRKELVQQICLTLAEEGVVHNIIAARKDIRGIIGAERMKYGKSFYDPHSKVAVISVDTLNSRNERYKNWAKNIDQWITDEAAHLLKDNKWGRAVALFENARGLGVTATPERLDRKGLGSHADGVFDVMVQGPPTRWGIENGFLSRYKIAIPESDYEKYLKSSSSTSDYSKKAMMEASNKSHIVGDVVENYLKHAKGKQAIYFATDVNTSRKMADKFNEAGISAVSLDGTTSDRIRFESMMDFESKKIKVLINVDLFDEGLDVPGIEVVGMARPTKSLNKFLQMVGRGLRVAEGKEFLILIDHVGNVTGKSGHGLPCDLRSWTLDRIRKRAEKLNFLRICHNIECNAPYDRALTECPYCGTEAIKASRGGEGGGRTLPEQVDGDLTLIDPETLREMQEKVMLEDPGHLAERISKAINPAAGMRAMKKQRERIETQQTLSEEIAKWAGVMKSIHRYNDRMINKKFYLHFNQTITEALGEPKADMEKLIETLRSGNYE